MAKPEPVAESAAPNYESIVWGDEFDPELSSQAEITQSVTLSFMWGRSTQFIKTEIKDVIVPGESAQDAIDRVKTAALRSAFQMAENHKALMEEGKY